MIAPGEATVKKDVITHAVQQLSALIAKSCTCDDKNYQFLCALLEVCIHCKLIINVTRELVYMDKIDKTYAHSNGCIF